MILIVICMLIALATAHIPKLQEQDPTILAIDDVEGLVYDVSEYEDPQMTAERFASFGALPIFTHLDTEKKYGNSKNGITEKEKLAESQRSVDDIIYKLQIIRSKLEKGNTYIYVDIEKAIQALKRMEDTFQPDFQDVVSSLRASLQFAKPLIKSRIINYPEQPLVLEGKPNNESPEFNRQGAYSLKVTSDGKPVLDKTAFFRDIKQLKNEKPIEIKHLEEVKPLKVMKLDELKSTQKVELEKQPMEVAESEDLKPMEDVKLAEIKPRKGVEMDDVKPLKPLDEVKPLEEVKPELQLLEIEPIKGEKVLDIMTIENGKFDEIKKLKDGNKGLQQTEIDILVEENPKQSSDLGKIFKEKYSTTKIPSTPETYKKINKNIDEEIRENGIESNLLWK